MMDEASLEDYLQFVHQFREMVDRAVPPDATVIVVSKGDESLRDLEGRRAWHFPQREDGVYAGYYPADSAAAIEHLEALRVRGGEYFVLPRPSFWWLAHYADFRHYLESRYRLVLEEPEVGLAFALAEPTSAAHPLALGSSSSSPRLGTLVSPAIYAEYEEMSGAYAPETNPDPLIQARFVLDRAYYGAQAGVTFANQDEALAHYLAKGAAAGHDPHGLFDTSYYLESCPEAAWPRHNPLLHYLTRGAALGLDPCPYFDTEYYYSQEPGLRERGVNPLIHYLRHWRTGVAKNPNPLFANDYYLNTYPDLRRGRISPLARYLIIGAELFRTTSPAHAQLVSRLLKPPRSALRRGGWTSGSVLLCCSGERPRETLLLLEAARVLASTYRLCCTIVSARRLDFLAEPEDKVRILALDDHPSTADLLRPAALRLLFRALRATRPLFSVCDTPLFLEPLAVNGMAPYYLCPEPSEVDLEGLGVGHFARARRVLFDSSDEFHAVAALAGRYPTNVALLPFRRLARSLAVASDNPAGPGRPATPEDGQATSVPIEAPPGLSADAARPGAGPPFVEDFADSLLTRVRRDLGLQADPSRRNREHPTRKILIPCSDWGISGVNSSLETIGRELIRLGWDVQIIFTRDEQRIRESAGSEFHLPRIPHRYLRPCSAGTEGLWQTLIAEVESQAPCILFMGYDFVANGIVPALSDDVGAVAWLQSDDGDYYEQAYRLGRYCNALVCVAQLIKDRVGELNPLIGARSHVIYNASIGEAEVVDDKTFPSETLRLVYAGRLVQYQKRVLDFIDLAHALDRTGTPYQITLIGEFKRHEDISSVFMSRARNHLRDGRIVLKGKMGRRELLHELDGHCIFVLISDFEGLPLALLEAMARGCIPVLAEMECGIREVVDSGENGLIVSGRDYDQWASQLVHLWGSPAGLTRMSRNARETVRDRFTAEHVGQQFDELLRRVAEELATHQFERPPCLNWGSQRSPYGDVLPPPTMYRA